MDLITWILIFHLWTRDLQPAVALTTAEFSSEALCKAAGQKATKELSGASARAKWICVKK